MQESRRTWDESYEPWLSQSIKEEAVVYVEVPHGGERAYHGRVCRDNHWVHVQTTTERLSFPREQVHAIKWEALDA